VEDHEEEVRVDGAGMGGSQDDLPGGGIQEMGRHRFVEPEAFRMDW
jgi:hypothetical protein